MPLAAHRQLDFDVHHELEELGLEPGRILKNQQQLRIIASRRRENPAALDAEVLFEKVVAGLGVVDVLKREDAGEVSARTGHAEAADFRVVLPDGEQFLVEIVTTAHRTIRLPQRRLAALREYAEKVRVPLRVATFWRALGLWTLTPIAALNREGKLPMGDALMWNDMVRLGDYMLGTVFPLQLRLVSKPADGGKRRIASAEFLAGNVEVANREDRQLALFLMLFGDWDVSIPTMPAPNVAAVMDFIAQPRKRANVAQEFEMVGHASTLLSRYFAQVAKDTEARAFVPPDFAQIVADHQSEALPLWRFQIEPKFTDVPDEVTKRLDAVYSTRAGAIDPEIQQASLEAVDFGDW
jgi:hypothetical protein